MDSFEKEWIIEYSTETVTASVSLEDAKVNKGNKLVYNFKTSTGIVKLYNNNFDELDISNGDAISFYYNLVSGYTNNLKLQVYDKDGDVFERKITSITSSGWQQAIIPLVSMSSWSWQYGNGVLDTKKITKLTFALLPGEGGKGYILFDKIENYKVNSDNSLLFDSFDFGSAPNCLGGNAGPWSHGNATDPLIIYDKENAKEGIYCLKITYNYLSDFCGYWSKSTPEGGNFSRDISNYTHISFWAKSLNGTEKFKLELKDSEGNQAQVNLTNITTTYQNFSIPLTSFTGVNFSKFTEFVIVFDQNPKNGTIFLDSIYFTKGNTPLNKFMVAKVDNLDLPYSISGWKNYGRDENLGITQTSLSDSLGYENSSLRLDFQFKRKPVDIDDWVAVERDWGINISTFDQFSFLIKGENLGDNLIVRLADKDGVIYQRKYFNITNISSDFYEVKIPISEFTLYKASNTKDKLDLTKIKGVTFILEKRNSNNGYVLFDELKLSKKEDSYQTGSIIKFLETENLVFSPNFDNIKDKVIFKFELYEQSNIILQIFNVSGEKIFEIYKGGCLANNKYIIEWDGKDKDTKLVKNGPYFFKFNVDSLNVAKERKYGLIIVAK